MKRALLWLTGILVVLVTGAAASGGFIYAGADRSNLGELSFENPLAIPPLLEPRAGDAGRAQFDLELQAGRAELVPGRSTETWGANGPYMAPTLRASRGDVVSMRVRNQLPERTTIHWHGMHLPASADGGPHQVIEPGGTWTPSWTIDQPAATLWYHPHPHGETEDHVYRGLFGMFILDDPDESPSLPSRYGVDDIPVMLQDVRLNDDGSLDWSKGIFSPTGRLGSTILVNGTHDPHLEVSTERVRLRLLNASTARIYEIGFTDGREFDLVAGDGGLLASPHRTARVPLSPGERAEIVVAVKPGERPVLRSFPPDLGMNFFEERFAGGDDSFDLLELRAAERLEPSPRPPERLAELPAASESQAGRTRRFELQGQGAINGRSMDMARIDEMVPAGETELWEVENGTGTAHNFHVHGTSFRVLSVAGERPRPGLSGWKDTVFVPPGKVVRMLVSFEHPDPANPLMYHCHLLQHEDRGMMGQALIIRPEEGSRFDPDAVPHQDHGG